MGQSERATDIMTVGTGRRGAMTRCTIIGCSRDVGVMGQLAVLGGMTSITLVVGLNNRFAARYTSGMAGVTGNRSGVGVGVM